MPNVIAERLRIARKAAGFTQASASKELNLSQTGYSYYETGKREIKGFLIKDICRLFHISPSYLLGVTDDPTPDIQASMVSIPVYGSIAAGSPIETFEQDGTFEIPYKIANKYPDAFLLRVKGESMNRILPNGCLALVSPCKTVDYQGKPYALSVNGNTATIKRVRKLANGFELIPDSIDPTYQTEIYNYNEQGTKEITIIGRVVWHTLPEDWSY